MEPRKQHYVWGITILAGIVLYLSCFVVSETDLGRMVRSARYKYCQYKGGEPREMLIDMEKDPGEMKNLAGIQEYENVLAEHRRMLDEWISRNSHGF